MAWGYWTAYSTSYGNQNRRQRTLSPPNKRDRSLERERDRISLAATAATPDCVSRTSVTYVSGSGAGSGRDNDAGIMATAVRNHPGIGKQMPPHHLQENHVEPEKVAYERRLLLGEPDWANRTLADRNTLPRKKQPEYDKSSGSEALYSGGEGSSGQPPGREEYIHDNSGHSPPTTPLDSGSHKSDEIFCPACAHQSSQAASSSRGDINSNRDSRVSFGSVASSSRGSRGSGSGRGGGNGMGVQHRGSQGFGGSGIMGRESIPISIPPPQHHSTSPSNNHHHLSLRARSRSQDDDDRCSSRGGLSSSLPTPPPPPTYSSHRDILSSSNNHGNADERIAPSLQSTGQGTASILMESINKKMSMFSKFKTPPQSQEQPYAASSRAPHLQNQYHHESRISSQKYHTMSATGDGNNRESRNYYLHNPFAGATSTNFRQHYDENTQQPASILVQAATAAALNHYTTSTSSNRSIQKSSNTSSIEKAAGSSASRDQSSSSLHSLRGGGNESHEIHPIQSPTTMPFNMSSKPALPPKPSKPIQESNRQHSGDCDVHHFQQISRDGAIGHMERSKNQQQFYYPKEREDQGSSNSYHHQRSYSAGRRSNLVHSRSGSRTPRGSSSRTSRESLEHNKRSRESLSNTRDKVSHTQGHGEAKYSRTRGRRASNEQLEDADRDGDEESEGGNTNPRGVRNTNRNTEHRVRVTQHHHRDSSQNSGGRGSSTSHGRSSRESGSIIGIRNRKSSSVDEMTCGDATIHRGEYDDDVISTNSSSVKRRKSHIGVYTSNPDESKERVSNDADNENDLEDEEDEEDEDNRGTMRRRRIRTTSASDHSEVSGTRPPPFNTIDKNSTTRDRLSSGEIGDADVDEEEDSNQKEVSAKMKQVHSTPQDNSYNTNTRSLRSSQSQTPEDDDEICVGDKEMRKKIAKKVELCEKEKLEKLIDAPLDKSKLSIDNGENFSRSLSECDDYKKGYNAATLKRNVRKGSLSESKHDQTSSEKGSTFKTDQDHSGKRSDSKQVPFTASPPSFSISGTPDQSIFTFGRQSHSTTHQQCQEQTDPPISRSSMSNNSRGNVQYFKHYDHREQFQVQQSDGNSADQHQLNFAHHARKQRPFNFKALTSTAPAIRKDLSDHPNRYSSERQLMADHKRKSASIGDRLSDADNFEDEYTSQRIIDRNNRHERENRNQNRLPFRDDDEGYRKSYTLDERHSRRGHGNNDYDRGRTLPNQSQRQLSHNHHISSMGSFQNIAPPPSTIGSNYPTSSSGFTNNKKFHHHHQQHQPSANSSTKSEKSSSRSSHSPSIDGNKYGNNAVQFGITSKSIIRERIS